MFQYLKKHAPEVPILLAWIIILAFASWTLGGCKTTQPRSGPEAAIEAAEVTVITAVNTLADAADAGIISRQSESYQTLKVALIEAADMIRFAWMAHLDGNQGEADEWRRSALSLYAKVRPALEGLSREGAP